VETEEHRRQLKELRCDYGQGYLFAKPLNAAEAREMLRRDWLLPSNSLLSAPEAIGANSQSYAM
jgi:hypothetical protein